MKKTKQILSIAALAIVGTLIMGCNKEDFKPLVLDTDDDNVVTLKTTVSLEGGSQTRALNDNGTEVVKTFAVNDQITVIYKNTSDETASAVSAKLTSEDIHNNGKTATFTVTMTNPKPEGKVRYIYPATMAKATISATTDPSDDEKTINYNELGTQDGTLAGSKYDLAVYDGNLTSDEPPQLPVSVKFENPLVLCAFTLKYGGSDNINSSITKMTISDGTNSYKVNHSIDASPIGPIYVAIRPTDNVSLWIFATNGTTGHYSKTLTSKQYKAGLGYKFSLNMTTDVLYHDLSTMGPFTGGDGDGKDAYIYQSDAAVTSNTITIKDGKKVILDGVNINAGKVNAISCLGNATIVLSGTNTVKNTSRDYATILAGPSSTTLTINGNGTLNVRAKKEGTYTVFQGAFIGADYSNTSTGTSCGNIIINGGTIDARVEEGSSLTMHGAAIGSGRSDSGTSSCGNITINGGDVTAIGAQGAGIGCGHAYNSSCHTDCGTITITGGIITARATGGAAIGSGNVNKPQEQENSRCGSIIISGGEIDAQTTGAGAAIGTGGSGGVGTINISGGTIKNAKCTYATTSGTNGGGAGIGSGKLGICEGITITGGDIKATGGSYAAGIGSARGRQVATPKPAKDCYSSCGAITITSGVKKVEATKGANASNCIGLGISGDTYYSSCGTVTIGGSTTVDTSGASYTYQPTS